MRSGETRGAVVRRVLILVGLFWSGRESTHGFSAFWDHWWCASARRNPRGSGGRPWDEETNAGGVSW